jgi:hypothetical protein
MSQSQNEFRSLTVPQPFQYQGSQRVPTPFILQYLPISTTRLVDSRHDEAISLGRELRGGGGRDQAGRIAHAGNYGGQNPGSRRALPGTFGETGRAVSGKQLQPSDKAADYSVKKTGLFI